MLLIFYDIHGRKREVLFFYFVPDTTQDSKVHKTTNLNLDVIYQGLQRQEAGVVVLQHGAGVLPVHLREWDELSPSGPV
jgi:hypothetical protein